MGFQENHEQDWCACLSFLELSNPWANKKLFHLKWFLSMEKKYQSKIDISKLYILELWKSLVFHFFVFSSLCYGISYKHDEKTKKIGKQRGMGTNNKIEHNITWSSYKSIIAWDCK